MSISDLPALAELEADKPKTWWDRLRTLALAARIGTLVAQPLPDEALPPPPPPKVEAVSPTDRDRRRRRRGPESELGDQPQYHLM